MTNHSSPASSSTARNSTTSSNLLWFWLCIGLLFFLFVYLIRGVLLPFVLGTAIAYFLDPAVDRLEKHKLSRGFATSLIILSFFLIIAVAAMGIIPTLSEQLSGLLVSIPEYAHRFETEYQPQLKGLLGALPADYVSSAKGAAANASGMVMKLLGDMVSNLFQSGMAIVNALSLILITPVVAFYLLRDWDRITHTLHALLPRPHAVVIREQLAIIDTTLAGFIRGQINVCLLMGCYYALGLSLTGLKFGALIGFTTGFLVILPYVGAFFGMATGLIVAFFQFGTLPDLLPILAVFITGQLIEGYAITPKLVGEKVGLHPVWIIFGMLAGAALFGFVGVFLAIPMSAVMGVLLRFALSRYLHSRYYHGDLPRH